MKLESVALADTALPAGSRLLSGRTLSLVLVASVIVWTLAWYGETAQSMVATWRRSDTFAHGFIIVPISLWLIWQRRHELAALEYRPGLLALPVLAVVGAGWLLGHSGGVMAVQQFALVLMIPLVVWAVLGNEVVRILAFPLLFLLFAVPFGEFLEPVLMEHTADFAVAALRMTGIPVYREGLFFTIPSGSWSVVEACSGLRYLIASLTVGVLYAYLTYRSLRRRLTFVGLSLVVPIVANWLRAYMIVMIGHLTSMQYAVGVDHLIYGWVFFGVVMLLLFWIGSFWREDLEAPAATAAPRGAPRPQRLGGIAAAAVAAAVIVAAWPAAADWLTRGTRPLPVLEQLPPAGAWRPAPGTLTSWTPHYQNAQATLHQAYVKDAQHAGIYVAYYHNQRPGAQLVSVTNTLVSRENPFWKNMGEAGGAIALDRETIPSIDARLRGSGVQLLVRRWFWIDGHYVVNPYWAKVLQAKSLLLGRGDAGAVIMVYAPYAERTAEAESVLNDFTATVLPSLTRDLENARRATRAY